MEKRWERGYRDSQNRANLPMIAMNCSYLSIVLIQQSALVREGWELRSGMVDVGSLFILGSADIGVNSGSK